MSVRVIIIRPGTIGGLTVTRIIPIRTGVIGTGGTITGTTIELRLPEMNCSRLWPQPEDIGAGPSARRTASEEKSRGIRLTCLVRGKFRLLVSDAPPRSSVGMRSRSSFRPSFRYGMTMADRPERISPEKRSPRTEVLGNFGRVLADLHVSQVWRTSHSQPFSARRGIAKLTHSKRRKENLRC
jgi:hypothetical protein